MNHSLRYTQNFLQSQALVSRIVDLAKLNNGDHVLEIGPGKGIITQQLAEQVTPEGKVIAVELDETLAQKLRSQFNQTAHVEIIQGDIRDFDLTSLDSGYSVFSNIPFSITSELLEFLFDPTYGPVQAHLILQKDVIVGMHKSGFTTETLKSLMLKTFYDIRLVYSFSKSDFLPQPSVETGLFAFEKLSSPLIDAAEHERYKDFIAFVSKDRVGEGVWTRLFSKPQLQKMTEQSDLVYGRGIKSQSIEGIVAAFNAYRNLHPQKHEIVHGAMSNLRDEQQRREKINRAGGHHRSKKGKQQSKKIR